ncbi:GNAT family N-acetyltransferase [Streptomyces sp. NPDC005820]|uniref:GNAT family N-acetyltransferase n=1 Tax=Streptomyces sp. NPDC005820 TaxID=3157069 RepID=UPI0033F14847
MEWAELSEADVPAVVDLAVRCAAVDGGLPATTSPGFLGRRYAGEGVTAVGAFQDGLLTASGSVRGTGGSTVVTGQVDPSHRGRGHGTALLDRLLETARRRADAFRVETESLTPEADVLFTSRGLHRTFAEDVMRRDLRAPFPEAVFPAGVEVEEWNDTNRVDFFEAYASSFADRPGFPGWSQDHWIDWTAGDDDFRPPYSLLARSADGSALGFVTCARDFLIQVGTVPPWRHRGLGRALAVTALTRMRDTGEPEVFLDVNLNNPASATLFRRLGFTPVARRARYELRRDVG